MIRRTSAFATLLPGIAILPILFGSSLAAAADKPPTDTTTTDMEKGTLSVAATPVLPVGDLADAFGFGIGAVAGVDVVLHPHASFVGRLGYIHHLPRNGLDATLGALPVWAGARYQFLTGDRTPYLEGTLGPTVWFASVATPFGRVSDSELKVGTALGAGYRHGRFDAGGRLVLWDLGHAGESAALMATIGYAFVAF